MASNIAISTYCGNEEIISYMPGNKQCSAVASSKNLGFNSTWQQVYWADIQKHLIRRALNVHLSKFVHKGLSTYTIVATSGIDLGFLQAGQQFKGHPQL